MGNIKIKFNKNDIENDIKKYSNSICKNVATEIREDLTNYTARAIDCFYDDYTPKFYIRNYYNFKNKSFKKYYQNAHNSIYRGGVELSPEFMDDIYNGTKEQVFYSVYEGIHGLPIENNNIAKMSPSPLELIYKKREEIIKDIDIYTDRAKKIAQRESYSILKFN